MEYLESEGWDYQKEFVKAYNEASPDEKLRYFGKTLPFLFHRIDTETPAGDTNVQINIGHIRSKEDMVRVLAKDPFIDFELIAEEKKKNAERDIEPAEEVPILSGPSKRKSRSKSTDAGTVQDDAEAGSGKKLSTDTDKGSA